MTEEAAPDVPEQDTPTPTSEDGGTPAEATETPAAPEDYENRYKEAQAWGTRASQEAAEYRQLIDLARAGDKDALEFLGYAPADEETEEKDEEFETEDDRLERLEQQFAEQKQAAEQQAQEQRLEEAAGRFYEVEFNRLDPDNEWSEEYRRLVAAVGDEYLDSDGLPQLDEAHKALQEHTESEFKKRVESKRSPQAPKGASPSHTPDLDDPEQRRAYLAQRAAEIEGEF